MKKKLFQYLFCISCAFVATTVLQAAETETTSTESTSVSTSDGLWTATVAGNPSGAITVPIRLISSVTIHNYNLNGKIPIAELTIDTLGNNTIRFYCVLASTSDAADLMGMARELQGEVNKEVSMPSVAKQYPDTTHAHSIEYSVSSVKQLKSIYTSVSKCLSTGKGEKMTIK